MRAGRPMLSTIPELEADETAAVRAAAAVYADAVGWPEYAKLPRVDQLRAERAAMTIIIAYRQTFNRLSAERAAARVFRSPVGP